VYLVEALKYDVPAFHEDRLTQILSATFNNSAHFRRRFLTFLKVPFREDLSSRTQVANESAPSRPDLIISTKNGDPYILVESKVSAQTRMAQQDHHARLLVRHNFLFVRDPVIEDRVAKSFKKVTWCDFFCFLAALKTKETNAKEAFLISELLNYGKECDMLLPDRITIEDMSVASKFLTQTRLRKHPSCGFGDLTPFRAMENISLFLERVILKMKEDSFLSSKTAAFTRKVGVSHHYDIGYRDNLKKSKSKAFEEQLKGDALTIEKSIKLRRKVNGHSKIFLKCVFLPFYKKLEVIDLPIKRIATIPLSQIHYRCEVVVGLGDATGSFNDYDCVAFDDKDALEFADFYRETLKHLRKKLS
jgi:hypothetical protein